MNIETVKQGIMEKYYFKPSEFGGDWCETCSEYFISEYHINSALKEVKEKLSK